MASATERLAKAAYFSGLGDSRAHFARVTVGFFQFFAALSMMTRELWGSELSIVSGCSGPPCSLGTSCSGNNFNDSPCREPNSGHCDPYYDPLAPEEHQVEDLDLADHCWWGGELYDQLCCDCYETFSGQHEVLALDSGDLAEVAWKEEVLIDGAFCICSEVDIHE